jgi:hypothetical protein
MNFESSALEDLQKKREGISPILRFCLLAGIFFCLAFFI